MPIRQLIVKIIKGELRYHEVNNGHGFIYAKPLRCQSTERVNIPLDNNSFDWAWSADCIGYGPWEPLPLLKELARVVKPGGIVAISGWSSENLLPGYPRLEARLRATSVGIAPFVHGKKPETHFLRALGWFSDIGLKEPAAKVFADSFYFHTDTILE